MKTHFANGLDAAAEQPAEPPAKPPQETVAASNQASRRTEAH
jgi:hypothetical protein